MNANVTTLALVPAVVVENLGSMVDFVRAARKAAGRPGLGTVVVVPGAAAPVATGTSRGWYTNRTGETIRHPSAYRRHGWSSLVYHASTLTVTVGADWRPTTW